MIARVIAKINASSGSSDAACRSPGVPASLIARSRPTAVPWILAILAVLAFWVAAHAEERRPAPRVLRVEPGTTLPAPSDAAKIARNGDIVEIAAAEYRGDVAVWRQNNLIIRGTGGIAHLYAAGAHAEGKAIWVIKGDNTTVENVGFHDAKVPHRNGAGIRQEGAGLNLIHCIFTGNENGILTSPNPQSDILITHSEFGYNGDGSGQTHNIYVGGGRSLTVRYSHVHHAIGGHGIKSRAARTEIWYSRIADDLDGRSSYEIEIPNGGIAILVGNLIQQSAATSNFTLVSYGVEGLRHPINTLHAAHNTLVNARADGGRFFYVTPGAGFAYIVNNVLSGPGIPIVGGPAHYVGNMFLSAEEFVNSSTSDYRPRGDIKSHNVVAPLGAVYGISLLPLVEYVHPRGSRARRDSTVPAAGAFSPAASSHVHSPVD